MSMTDLEVCVLCYHPLDSPEHALFIYAPLDLYRRSSLSPHLSKIVSKKATLSNFSQF